MAPEIRTFDQLRDDLRAVYTTGISEIMDRCLEELVLPSDKAALALDAAQFIVFLMAIKSAEASGQILDKRSVLSAYWPIQKGITKEVPGMILETLETQGAA